MSVPTIQTSSPTAPPDNLEDLLTRLGDVPARRIRMRPAPGTATEQDAIDAATRDERLCELVDGTLVEKVMGYPESILAAALIEVLRVFVRARKLGLVSGPDGMIRLFPGIIRIPDVAFVSWDRVPGRRVPRQPAPQMAPDLAIEVLSPGNTATEMQRKIRDYFEAGVRLVWIVDPETRTVSVHRSADRETVLKAIETLDGGDVLPGFALPLRELFAELDEQPEARPG